MIFFQAAGLVYMATGVGMVLLSETDTCKHVGIKGLKLFGCVHQ